MFAPTFVDPQAVRALGTANCVHAADLEEIASTLSSLSSLSSLPAPPTFGPVGARFLAALAAAAAEAAHAVREISEALLESNATAYAAAAAYVDADHGASARIAGV